MGEEREEEDDESRDKKIGERRPKTLPVDTYLLRRTSYLSLLEKEVDDTEIAV